MKRLIAMVLVLMLFFPSLTVFASNDDEILNALYNTEYLSGEFDYKITFEMTLPLPAFLDPDGIITEILSTVEFLYNIKYDKSEDNKKMQSMMNITAYYPSMDMEMDMNINMKYWLDMDLSDADNPKYKIIFKSAVDDKFMYMDLVNATDSSAVQTISDYIDSINVINNKLAEDKNLEFILEYRQGKYIIILDESNVKNLFKDIITGASRIALNYYAVNAVESMSTESSVGIIGGADGPTSIYITDRDVSENNSVEASDSDIIEAFDTDSIMQEFEKQIEEFFEKLENVQLFDENAVVIEVELDDSNLIKKQKLTLNIKTNLAEVMEVFDTQNDIVTKENSDIGISIIMDLSCSKINEQIDIEFPELTEENSIDLMEALSEHQPIDESKINIIANGQIMNSDVDPIIKDDKVYVPIRACLNTLGVSDDDIVYHHKGRVNINYGDTIVKLTIGSDIAEINGKEVILDEPIFTVGDRTMVSSDFIADVFNCNVDWIPFYNEKGEPLSAGIMYITTKTLDNILSIMIPSSMAAEDVKILDKASFDTGIIANIVTISTDNYKDKVMLMIAAGEPCAFLNWKFDDEWEEKWIEMDAFMPLEELIEEYAPNIRGYLEKNPDIRKAITSDDGHIYYIPFLQVDEEGECGFSLIKTIRNPEYTVIWLDYLFSEQIQLH